jgi:hypothetical protein
LNHVVAKVLKLIRFLLFAELRISCNISTFWRELRATSSNKMWLGNSRVEGRLKFIKQLFALEKQQIRPERLVICRVFMGPEYKPLRALWLDNLTLLAYLILCSWMDSIWATSAFREKVVWFPH